MNEAGPLFRPGDLGLWQRLVAALVLRDRRRRRSQARRLPRPVVSVGGLHFGGSGKTPLVAALARELSARGWKVGILSRGYRRRSRGPLIVSRGDHPLLSVSAAGDEPLELARDVPGVAVAVGESRYEAGQKLLAELPHLEVFLLDDGFSHQQLARDVELVALPAKDPFGGFRFPPSGRLRLPVSTVAEAHAIVLTGAPEPDALEPLRQQLDGLGFRGPAFLAFSALGMPRNAVTGEELPPGSEVVAVAGIARPENFFEVLKLLPLDVRAHVPLPDHARYDRRQLAAIQRACRRARTPLLVTTPKDYPKLESTTVALFLHVVRYQLRVDREFVNWVVDRLCEVRS